MRNLFCGLAAAAMLFCVLSADADTPAQTKKAPPKTTTSKMAAAAKKSSKTTAAKAGKTTPRSSVTAKNGKNPPARRAPAPTWRNRQVVPTPDRYKEIQQALAAKGYLNPEDANGAWNQSSVDALQKFQADQKLESTGKINSLSLIALGLGPKHTGELAAPAVVPIPPEEK